MKQELAWRICRTTSLASFCTDPRDVLATVAVCESVYCVQSTVRVLRSSQLSIASLPLIFVAPAYAYVIWKLFGIQDEINYSNAEMVLLFIMMAMRIVLQ